MMEKKRVESYDWVRTIAIILVVVGHGSYLAIETALGGVEYTLPSTLNGHYDDLLCKAIRSVGSWAYQFHMPLFFALSGAVTAITPMNSFDVMFEKKLRRLIIPYYVYGLLFMFPIKYMAGFYEREDFKYAMRSYLEISECGHMWFLPVLFWCFIATYILLKLNKGRSLYLLFVVSFFIWKCIPINVEGYYGLTLCKEYLIWFVIGYIFENKRRDTQILLTTKEQIIRIVSLSVVVWAMSGTLIKPDDFISVLIKIYWIYCVATFSMNLLGIFRVIRKFVGVVSANCIYIYVFHDPLEYLVLKYAFKYNWLSSGYGVYFYFFARTMLVFLISLYMGILITYITQKWKKGRLAGSKC